MLTITPGLHIVWIGKEGKTRLLNNLPFDRSWQQRIEHYLENLPDGADWREFCATTPVRFRGLEFAGAQECFQWVRVI